MVKADLHVHTTNSDGTLTLDSLPGAARRADVSVVAVTDHDRIHPELDAPVTDHDGILIVRGIELRVAAADQRLDLLGYSVERTPALESLIEEIQQNRIERGRDIIESVEDDISVSLPIKPREGLGRPHIARAIAESPADYDYQNAFDDLIGSDCPHYVARDIPPFERGVAVLSEACAVVGLAHPFRYDDVAAALEHTSELDAVERYYPYDHTVDPTPVEAAVEQNDLIVTGGSDAHDKQLGRAGLDGDAFQQFRTAVGF